MRQHPIGTGPFKFVEFKLTGVDQAGQEPGLWLEARPALSHDGIDYKIVRNRSTIILAPLMLTV